ncbi:hypothetical protein GZH53_07775 [Flavihumibacter sp. R14]|nr:hypothetical protein [Flavihumibacter soli]
MRRPVLIILFSIAIMITGCEKSTSDHCGGDRPDETLTWLKTRIESLAKSTDCYSISRSTYKGQTVFILSNCQPNVNSIPALYDCDGMQLTLTNGEYQNLNFTGPIELIWKNR